MDNEKKQQDKIIELEKQLENHNQVLEAEKQKKQQEDAAKGSQASSDAGTPDGGVLRPNRLISIEIREKVCPT